MTADAALVRRCLTGDPAACRELVEKYQSDVFTVCQRLLAHCHDAEDVTQEVFLPRFPKSTSLGLGTPSSPVDTWDCGESLPNLGGSTCKGAGAGGLPARSPGSRPADDSVELRTEIRAAVDALRGDYREVFVLFHERGQSYDQISQVVDRPVGTVKTWLHRARLELLERLRCRGLVPDEPSPDPSSARTDRP